MDTINKQHFNTTLISVPNYVGCYKLAGLSIFLEKKPNWFHRTMMKMCLGWEWVNNNTNNESK